MFMGALHTQPNQCSQSRGGGSPESPCRRKREVLRDGTTSDSSAYVPALEAPAAELAIQDLRFRDR
jgi:hypothetical protein